MKPNKAANVASYILGMAFNLAILAVVAYAIYTFANWGFNRGHEFAHEMLAEGPNEEVLVTIPEDLDRADAARLLYSYGVINNPWLFQLELFLKNSTRIFRAGTYTLNLNMTNTEVNAVLRRGEEAVGEAAHHTILVREGWRIRDIGEYMEYRGFFTAEEFMDYAQNGDFSGFHFLRDVPDLPGRNRLEGYLFPNTYWVPLEPTPRQLIVRMLNHFEETIEGPWLDRAYELGFTFDEIITIASIVEAETGRADERALVSQVIHLRLERGMRLEMDPTAIYLLDVHRSRVLRSDLLIDSPYNTHTREGLPIGPIGNPGRASIEAALFPSYTNYLFFVVDYSDHSRHVFNTNYPDHNAAAQRYWASLDR